MRSIVVFVLVVSSWLISVDSLIHHLVIEEDSRHLFKIESFGFDIGGVMELKLSDFSMNGGATLPMGFVMRRSDSESQSEGDMEATIEQSLCPFVTVEPEDVLIDISVAAQNNTWSHPVDITHEFASEKEVGLYTLLFARCSEEADDRTVSFTLDVTFKNKGHGAIGTNGAPNWDYLSAGDRPLPLMYMVLFVLFFAAFLVWMTVLRRDPVEHGTVHKIHYLMALLLVLKCCTLLTESVRYHMISSRGTTGFMSLLYYLFSSMRGVMLFTVVMLIGSGWSIMRGFLHDREKKVVLIVLIAQVINNTAMVILEETAPGSVVWTEWRFAMHLFDLACCLTILLPIVWSIQHLQTVVESGGKGQTMLAKLRLFRSFYTMVVTYIYFTRIAVYLIEAVVPFHLIWTGPFSAEMATFLFYVTTGVKFQPALDNPYLTLAQDDDIDSSEHDIDKEFGFVDSDDESKGVQMREVHNPLKETVEI
eukprot:GSChrysophyteH1.ASY1.ANO1.1132.1 assembled CDS